MSYNLYEIHFHTWLIFALDGSFLHTSNRQRSILRCVKNYLFWFGYFYILTEIPSNIWRNHSLMSVNISFSVKGRLYCFECKFMPIILMYQSFSWSTGCQRFIGGIKAILNETLRPCDEICNVSKMFQQYVSYLGVRSLKQTLLIKIVKTFPNIKHNISPSKPLRLEHIIHIIILQKQTKPYSSRILI